MDLAPQACGVQPGFHRSDRRRRPRIPQPVQRDGPAQQQRVGLGIARVHQRQRLAELSTVEQPVGLRGHGVDLGIRRHRSPKVGPRRRIVAHALRQFGPQQRQPTVTRRLAGQRGQVRRRLPGLALQAAQFGDTGPRQPRQHGPERLEPQRLQGLAHPARLRPAPRHLQHRRPRQPGLRLHRQRHRAVRREGFQVGQRGCKVMLALPHRRPQQPHRGRRIGQAPPRRQRPLRLPQLARIAEAARPLDRGLRRRQRQGQLLRIAGQPGALLAGRSVQPGRQPLHHLVVAGRGERCGLRQRRPPSQQQRGSQRPGGGGGGGGAHGRCLSSLRPVPPSPTRAAPPRRGSAARQCRPRPSPRHRR